MRRYGAHVTIVALMPIGDPRVKSLVRRLQIGPDDEDRQFMAAQREEYLKQTAAASALQAQASHTAQLRPAASASNWASAQVAVADNTEEVIIANQALIAYEEEAQAARDELTVPRHPDELVPYHARVNKHTKLKYLDYDDPDKVHTKTQITQLPPPKQHPWVEEQPIGPHILHGDGQLGTHGAGDVGFDEGQVWKDTPKHWRGVNFNTTLGLQLPQTRGYVNPDTVVKHSLNLTGKGVFATHPIKKGDLIMLVRSTAVDLGFNSYTDRLVYMVRDILLDAHAKRNDPEQMEYLHTWICCGQQSSRVEYWPRDATARVVKMIGGKQILADLELHEHHIARIAAIIELNAFVVEGFYNEDKGKGYWPEAGLLNHSCIPNADYEVMTVDDFIISDYNPEVAKYKAKKAAEEKAASEEKTATEKTSDAASGSTATPSSSSAHATPDAAAAASKPSAPQAADHVHSEDCGCHHHHHGHHHGHHHAPPSSSGAGGAAHGPKSSSRMGDLTRMIKAFATSDANTALAEASAYQESKRFDAFVDKTLPGAGEVDASERGNRTITASPDEVEALEELKEANPEAAPGPSRLQKVQEAKQSGRSRVVDVLEQESEVDRAQAEADAEALLGYRRNDYVFACRANRDIAVGEEVLISYVPPEWRFDYRQYVLHARYRFWCRCPKCTPPVEYRGKSGPRFMMFIIMVYFVAQLALYGAQMDTLDMHALIEQGEDVVHDKRFRT